MRYVRFLFVLVVVLTAMPALSRPQPAAAAVTTATTFKVEATRELLIGGETRNGFIIGPNSDYVSLSACTNRTCPDKPAGVRDDSADEGIRTECGDKCWVRVVNPLNGRCAVAPLEDLGPEFKNDDWWKPTAERHINLRTEYAGADIPRGVPAAKRAHDGNDVGYGTSGGYGLDFRGEAVDTASGIDLGERTWSDLGLSMAAGNDYAWNDATGSPLIVSVSMLWLTGETVAVADRACLGTQTINNLPTSGVLAGDVLNVTSPSGANVRPTAGTSGTTKGVVPQNGRVIASGKTQLVSSQTWYEVRSQYGDGWMLGSTVTETTPVGIPVRTINPDATNNLTGIAPNTTGTTLSRVTIGGNSRVKSIISGVYSNQGPTYKSLDPMNVAGGKAYVGVADITCTVPFSMAQITMKVWYTDATFTSYATMPSATCPKDRWARVVTPTIVTDPAKTIDHINLYLLTGGTASAGIFHTDNARTLELG